MIAQTEEALAAHWRTLFEVRSAQQSALRSRESDFWGGRADVFARRIDTPDSWLDVILSRVRPGDTVLDVGAGAGRYAIPIAGRAKEVIALEPSAGMGTALLAQAEKRGVRNLRLIQSDWLSADAPRADVVLCAHVLYFTPDVVPFVRKLDEHSRRERIVVIRVDQAGAGLAPLYEEIRGEPQAPEPSFIDLYNLLYNMGIAADVLIVEGRNTMSSFESLDQAEATVTQSLAPETAEARAMIRPYLESRLVPASDGTLVFKDANRRIAIVTWGGESV